MPEKCSQDVCVKDDFVRIGEFIGSAVDIAAEVQKEQHLIISDSMWRMHLGVPMSSAWVNYNDLTATSLKIIPKCP